MKKIIYVASIALLLPFRLAAQGTDNPLTDLSVTRVNSRFFLRGALTGIGSSAALAGGNVIYSRSDASSISWNPAALSFLQGRSLVVDWTPGISQNLSRYYDVEGEVAGMLDDARLDYGTEATTVASPRMHPTAGFSPGIEGFALAVPFYLAGVRGGVGFGYQLPLVLDAGVTVTGINAGILSEQELEGEMRSILMRLSSNIDSQVRLALHQFLAGIAWEPLPGVSLGYTASRYRLYASALARLQVDGVLRMSGNEYFFNDPNDPKIDFANGETNALGYTFDSHYQGEGWGHKIGVAYKAGPSFHAGITIDLPPRIDVEGHFRSVGYTIPFIDFESSDGGDAGDMIDPLQIDLSKLTKTELTENAEAHRIIFELPRAYSLGMALGKDAFTFSLRFTRYSGVFSYDMTGHGSRGLEFLYGGGLGFDFKYFFIGLQASLVNELPSNTDGDDSHEPLTGIPLPKVNLGFRIPTPLGIWLDGIAGLEPAPMLRMSARYNF